MADSEAGGLAAQFQAITGASPDEAAMFIAMSGGNLETALSIFFDQGAGGGGAEAFVAPSEPALKWDGGEVPDWYAGLVWPETIPIKSTWLDQELKFTDGLGLPQTKNGPCGVLAAVHAVIIAQNWKSPDFGADFEVQPAHVRKALAAIISNTAADKSACHVCSWKQTDKKGEAVDVKVVPAEALEDALGEFAVQYTDAGGVILLLYSCLLSRGAQQVRADMASEGAETTATLVIGRSCHVTFCFVLRWSVCLSHCSFIITQHQHSLVLLCTTHCRAALGVLERTYRTAFTRESGWQCRCIHAGRRSE
jgi:hypothetical protein